MGTVLFAYHLNHGTSVKVVAEFGKSLKWLNQLKMRNWKKCNGISTINPSILDLTSIPVRFVDPEFDRQNELTRNNFHMDVHKIQGFELDLKHICCHCLCFFLHKMDKSENMDIIHSTSPLSLHQKLDASKSVSYTTVGPSAQTVQANSRQPLVGTDKNVKQPVFYEYSPIIALLHIRHKIMDHQIDVKE